MISDTVSRKPFPPKSGAGAELHRGKAGLVDKALVKSAAMHANQPG